MFFENHIQVFEARTEERVQSNLKKVNQLRSKFFEVTKATWLFLALVYLLGCPSIRREPASQCQLRRSLSCGSHETAAAAAIRLYSLQAELVPHLFLTSRSSWRCCSHWTTDWSTGCRFGQVEASTELDPTGRFLTATTTWLVSDVSAGEKRFLCTNRGMPISFSRDDFL